MKVLDQVIGWLRIATEAGIALLGLAIVLQVLFGPAVAFFPVDVVGNVVTITKSLGSEGLVGLVSLWVLALIFRRNDASA